MLGLEIVFWHWLALGVFLLIVELLAPGMFFLWMAQAAEITGFLLWLFPRMEWEFQIALFSVLSVLGIALARRFFKRHIIETDQPLLNRRSAQYVGRVFTLEQPIINGEGKIRVDDSSWKIRGEDIPVGTKVKVIGAEGVILLVEPFSPEL